MRNNKNWQTQCLVCAAPVINCGSGRPKGFCSDACKVIRRKETQRRYQHKNSDIRKAKRIAARGRTIPARTPSKMAQNRLRQRNMVAAEKMNRGKCAYHLRYFGSELYVTHDLMHIFEFDHVDRAQKRQSSAKRGGGVSRLIGRTTDGELIAEMEKCQLVCCNCHRLKTIQERDFSNIQIVESNQIELELK